ncbi:hypothetical protein NBRC110019_16230 [Neptunitalea chrysea]|uniref:DUF4328 domain-containing protein n=1 Tax=Neptunitalea chrysea TaxID=1647581 RepID=A0A9W6EW86_9FLAO|nr:DUF4328 domain-containing protein [Neptunitalea chrysea]GLB52583.1 hypothetical protein NBRC110019_16230 [Neptunitalea chrysea]
MRLYTIKDNQLRSKLVMLAFSLIIALFIIIMTGEGLQWHYLILIRDGEFTNYASGEMLDSFVQICYMLAAILIISSMIVFLLWFRRAYDNIHKYELKMPDSDPSAATWCFFVPFLNLVKPAHIMKEIVEFNETMLKKIDVTYVRPKVTLLASVWWLAYIFAGIIGRIDGVLTKNAEDINDYIINIQVSLVADVLLIISAAISLLVVNFISKEEAKIFKHISTEKELALAPQETA